jgi:hypothetical protein
VLCGERSLRGNRAFRHGGPPSTSKGIGIEVWLPTIDHRNGRVRDIGSGGWAGATTSDPTRIGSRAGVAKGYEGRRARPHRSEVSQRLRDDAAVLGRYSGTLIRALAGRPPLFRLGRRWIVQRIV